MKIINVESLANATLGLDTNLAGYSELQARSLGNGLGYWLAVRDDGVYEVILNNGLALETQWNGHSSIDELIARGVAGEPTACGVIPFVYFKRSKTLEEEILTAYQTLKMDELSRAPVNMNYDAFVQVVQENVDFLNKTFNNIAKMREGNLAEMFQRTRGDGYGQTRSL